MTFHEGNPVTDQQLENEMAALRARRTLEIAEPYEPILTVENFRRAAVFTGKVVASGLVTMGQFFGATIPVETTEPSFDQDHLLRK